MPHRLALGGKFVIGITTYVERYDDYFKPLYKSLSSLFPEVPIVVTVNGFPDSLKQHNYLRGYNLNYVIRLHRTTLLCFMIDPVA